MIVKDHKKNYTKKDTYIKYISVLKTFSMLLSTLLPYFKFTIILTSPNSVFSVSFFPSCNQSFPVHPSCFFWVANCFKVAECSTSDHPVSGTGAPFTPLCIPPLPGPFPPNPPCSSGLFNVTVLKKLFLTPLP